MVDANTKWLEKDKRRCQESQRFDDGPNAHLRCLPGIRFSQSHQLQPQQLMHLATTLFIGGGDLAPG